MKSSLISLYFLLLHNSSNDDISGKINLEFISKIAQMINSDDPEIRNELYHLFSFLLMLELENDIHHSIVDIIEENNFITMCESDIVSENEILSNYSREFERVFSELSNISDT